MKLINHLPLSLLLLLFFSFPLSQVNTQGAVGLANVVKSNLGE